MDCISLAEVGREEKGTRRSSRKRTITNGGSTCRWYDEYRRRVVRSRDLARCSVEEIVSSLKSQGVTDAVVISIKDGTDRRKTNTIILSFNTPQPPQHVTAGYLRISVAVYVPNPFRCYPQGRALHQL